MYLDDLMASCTSVQQAVFVQKQARALVEDAGFHFKKWVSNKPEVLHGIPCSDRATDFAPTPKGNASNNHVLGVVWKVKDDTFGYEVPEWEAGSTKRQILSQLTSLWDPIGFLAPYVVRAKMMVQELWKLKVDWDEQVPEEFARRWETWAHETENLPQVKIPRALVSREDQPFETSLQVFCDASQRAYGAIVYMRNVYVDGEIEVKFVTAKTRVAPQKPSTLTIPRLELNAAVLAVRLCVKVDSALNSCVHRVDFWSDSTIVLSWVTRKAAINTAYVINRVNEVEENSQLLRCSKQGKKVKWHHVSTEANASDDCTRGLSLDKMAFFEVCRYLQGPLFLKEPSTQWPSENDNTNDADIVCSVRRTPVKKTAKDICSM
jgi:ribonuclease HI